MQLYDKIVKGNLPKIIAIGKNYLEHVKQMGSIQIPKQPILFLKGHNSLVYCPQKLKLSLAKQHEIHHQLELGVLIGKSGTAILKQNAFNHIAGYFLAIDFTDRDQQQKAKKKGLPWSLSKSQDNFCPVSSLISKEINPYELQLELRINGQTKQKDITEKMHFKIDELITYISSMISLNQGDLILTGTPQGVSRVKIGDQLEAFGRINQQIICKLSFTII